MKTIQTTLTIMKSPLTTSLRKQTPINKKAIPYMTAKKFNFTYMKKIAIILFLITSSLSFGQAIANQPTNYMVCDTLNNGVENISLYIKNSEILGSQSDIDYSVTYFNTLIDAQGNINPIGNFYAATNETVYAKVTENNNTSNFDITSFQIILSQIVNPVFILPTTICENSNTISLPSVSTNGIAGTWSPSTISSITTTYIFTPDIGQCAAPYSATIFVEPIPIINTPPNLIQDENPSDGVALFDLTVQNSVITSDVTYSVIFYPSMLNAENNTSAISNPTAYSNISNPQTIGVRVYNIATGCYSITSFNLIVNSFPITNPTPFAVCDDGNDGFESFDLESKNAEILGTLNPLDYTVTYHETAVDAQSGINSIPSPYFNVNYFNQTLFVRVSENANPTIFSITTLDLSATPRPFIATTVPNLTKTENPFDGVSTFDLTSQNNYITTISTQIVNFYTTQTDAETLSNSISNPSSFTGNHLQVIWFSLTEPSTSCSTIGSFILNVVDSGTVVYIPDTNFKAKLIASSPSNSTASVGNNYAKIDINNDYEIQFTEAAVIDSLNVSYTNIIDMTGIEAFTNLKSLKCNNNQITALDLSNNQFLQYLYSYENSINVLNIDGLTNLETISTSINLLSQLNVSSCTNLKYLGCNGNNISSLNLTNNLNLIELDCSTNQISMLEISGLSYLTTIHCSDNEITDLYLSNLNSLTSLYCDNNQLTNIDLSSLTNLVSLYIYNNQLNQINLTGLVNLSLISSQHNQLSTLDLSTLVNLNDLDCDDNLITSLQLDQNINLTRLLCSGNLFTTLDLSNNSLLNILLCVNNPNLQTLFIKNGIDELNNTGSTGNIQNCPNLTYICADEFQIPSISANLPLITINSFCSFTPGGNFNTITGTASIDGNNNGCDASDGTMPYLGLNVSLNGVSTNTSVYTNGLGIYNLFTSLPGIYQLNPNLENPTYFNVSPVEVDSNTIDNSTTLQNFCITPNGSHPDVEVVLAPINPARPGFDAEYQIVYKNKGNQTLSGTVTLNYNDSVLDYVSASTAPTLQTTGVINWDYSNLKPFENRSIGLVLNVNSPVETPAVNIDDVLSFTTTITPIVDDEIPADNSFVYNQTVVGSYDPNDITCLQGDSVSPSEIGNYLHYVINFENTGTYYAENVVVQDIIDTTQYDITSLQVLNASHNMFTRINENKVEFVFRNINLDAISGNPPSGGHGNVLFKIKSKSNLVTGDFVSKNANIFFDYNAPIVTNDAETTFETLNNGDFNRDESLSIFPNPTSSILNIKCDNTIESIELYDIQGRILEKSFQSSNAVNLDISNRQNGIYFLKITSNKGSKVEKIVKN